MNDSDVKYMQRAIELAKIGMDANGGGPFGCVIVKEGKVVGEAHNRVVADNDPTAHAEVSAIREACRNLGTFQLDGCTIYSSCEPCPMCLGAIYWARPEKVYYAATRNDAAAAGFDDAFIYEELDLEPETRRISAENLLHDEAVKVFDLWQQKPDKTDY